MTAHSIISYYVICGEPGCDRGRGGGPERVELTLPASDTASRNRWREKLAIDGWTLEAGMIRCPACSRRRAAAGQQGGKA